MVEEQEHPGPRSAPMATDDLIAVCIASVPEHVAIREQCLHAALTQTRQPDDVVVVIDHDAVGLAATRNRAWRRSDATWIAFVDEVDRLLPHHLERLVEVAASTTADLVFPWYEVDGADGDAHVVPDPFPAGALQALQDLHAITADDVVPVTALVRRSALEAVGGFPEDTSDPWPADDRSHWRCWSAMVEAGCRVAHTAERTWVRGADARGIDPGRADRAELERRLRLATVATDDLRAELLGARSQLEHLESALVEADLENGRTRVDHHRLQMAEAQAARVPVLEASLQQALALADSLQAAQDELRDQLDRVRSESGGWRSKVAAESLTRGRTPRSGRSS